MFTLLGGCASAGPNPSKPPPRKTTITTGPANRPAHRHAAPDKPFTGDVTTSDPCANRLHDLCGSLLLYYALNHRLPERIEELTEIGGPATASSLACPVSNQPYVYTVNGLLAPDTKSLLILHDPAPSHTYRRWAISIVEPQRQNDALVTKVILVPDAFFQRPAATPAPPNAPAGE